MRKTFLPFLLCLFAIAAMLPQYVRAQNETPGPLVGTGDMDVVIGAADSYYISGDEVNSIPFNGTVTGEFNSIVFLGVVADFAFEDVKVKEQLVLSKSGSMINLVFNGNNEVATISVQGLLILFLTDEATLEVTSNMATLVDTGILKDYTGAVGRAVKGETSFTADDYVLDFDFTELSYDLSVEATSEWQSKEITYQWQSFSGSWRDISNETTNSYSTEDEELLRVLVTCSEVCLTIYIDVKPPLDDIDPLTGTGTTSVNILGQYTYRNTSELFVPATIFNATATGTFELIRLNEAQKDNAYLFNTVSVNRFILSQIPENITIHFTGDNRISTLSSSGNLILTRDLDAVLEVNNQTITLASDASIADYTGAIRQVSQNREDFIITRVTQLYNPIDKECDLLVKAMTDWESTITYQWQRYSEVNRTNEWTDIANATKQEYTTDKDGDYRLLVTCGSATLSVYFTVNLEDITLEPLIGDGGEDVVIISPYIYRYANEDEDVVNYYDGTISGQFNSLFFDAIRENTSCIFDNVTITGDVSISSEKATDIAYTLINLRGENQIQAIKVYGVLTLEASDDASLAVAKDVTLFDDAQLNDYSGLLTEVKTPVGNLNKAATETYQYLENKECLLTVKGTTTMKDFVVTYKWEKLTSGEWKAIGNETEEDLLVEGTGSYRGLITCGSAVLSGVFRVFGPVTGAGIDAVVLDDHLIAMGTVPTRYNNVVTGLFRNFTIAPSTPRDISISISDGSVANLSIDNKEQQSSIHIGQDMRIESLKATASSSVFLTGETFNEKATIAHVSIEKSVALLDYSGFIELLDVEGDTYTAIYPTNNYSTDEGDVPLSFGTQTSAPGSVAYIDLQKYKKIDNDSIWALEEFGSIPRTEDTELPGGVSKVDIIKEFIIKKPGFYRAVISLRGSNISFATPPVFVDGEITGSATLPGSTIEISATDGQMSIRLSDATLQSKPVYVYDTTGRLLHEERIVSEVTIPLSRGIYIVRVGEESFTILMK